VITEKSSLLLKFVIVIFLMLKDSKKIVNEPPSKTFIFLTLPAIASTFFLIIYEIIDMFWVAKLGTTAVASLSASSFVVWVLRGFSLTVAIGVLSIVSRRAGERDDKALFSSITNSIVSTIIFSIFTIIIFYPLCLNVYDWIRLAPEVVILSEEYSIVFISGLIFVYLMVTLEHIIRGMGDTKSPMIIIGVSLILNACIDPLFIFTFNFGLRGAAYATIISQMIGAVMMLFVLLVKVGDIKNIAGFSNFRKLKGYFFKIIKIGLPASMSEVGFSSIYLLLSGIISMFGKEPLAAMGIAHRLEALPFFISLGFAMAVETMVGQNLGAGNIKNAKNSVYFSLKLASGILIII